MTSDDRFSQHAIARDVFSVVPTHDGRVHLTVWSQDGREVAGITMPGSSAAWLAQELLDAAKQGTSARPHPSGLVGPDRHARRRIGGQF